ncbi:MAG: tRNA (adenosine(37)-N6)-threonylcarbamoyltransferase complex transferase subunit TsaD [Candidatus Saccharimonadales bacterium]
MKILAIETSCDETSVAVVEDGKRVLSLVVNSQIDLHKAFGGVVPEVAARSHIEVMLPVVQQALEEALAPSTTNHKLPNANDYWNQIDAIAVTQGPGLLGSLLIGVLTARTLAWSLNKPLYPIHHILGHVYANWITAGPSYTTPYPVEQPEFPILALIVSGGHTQLMYATNHKDWRVIGRTTDDAVGEAFDKAAKVLGLPYPGGISLSKLAQNGDAGVYHLPTPKVSSIDPGLVDLRSQSSGLRENIGDSTSLSKNQDLRTEASYNFSFSGLKTALLRAVQKECGKSHNFPSFELSALLSEPQRANFAASFEATAINYLVSRTKAAFEEFQPKTVIIGGGVAASIPLRKALSAALPLEIKYAPQILCTDNAAMIGARAYFQSKNEDPVDPRHLETTPTWPL